ncbi:histone deacetylase [Kitasatospora sp. NPDC088861]|uniref:histone deacetylase n=1 Tax=Kitasatospora sp. NPDC088861 TaxID=3364078 RepID=UPI0038080047
MMVAGSRRWPAGGGGGASGSPTGGAEGSAEGGAEGGAGLVWYAAYGSNLHAARLACYLRGGRPDGGARTYPGCRDRRPPRRDVATVLPGTLYFARESAVWGGGSGYYDPDAPGELPCRIYLVTASQFSDIAAQEMHRSPGADLDLTRALAHGRDQRGPGRYETLVHAGALDGHPLLTFTASEGLAGAALNPPSAPYLRTLAAGLAESHGWSTRRCADYLASRPGAAGHWNAADVLAVLGGGLDL